MSKVEDIKFSDTMLAAINDTRELLRREHEAEEKKAQGVSKTERKMIVFDYAFKVRDVVHRYYSAIEQQKKDLAEIQTNYAGEMRDRKLKEYRAAMLTEDTTIKEIEHLTQIYRKHLDKVESEALRNAANLEAFKLLDLPVVFTAIELQTLHDENADNPLFCRALTEYFNKHQLVYNVMFDFRDGVTVRRELLAYFLDEMVSLVKGKDDYMLKFFEASNYFDEIDAKFKGNGLYKQPKIIEPEEGAEGETFQAPLPDDFEKSFKGETV